MVRKRGGGPFAAFLAIAIGMGGEMHIPVPGLGTLAMLDFASYIVALPIILMNWPRMGKFMRCSLKWAFAWTIASMLANLVNFYDIRYWAKCVSLASSSWAIMSAAYVLLKNYPKGYMWYLVGAGIGGWIALYHFRNGAIEYFAQRGSEGFAVEGTGGLIDKQIYPSVAKGILLGCILPFFLWWKKFPIFVVLVSIGVTAFWLLTHGGSRSSFGLYMVAAVAGFGVAYGRQTVRRLARHPFWVISFAGLFLLVLFIGYKYMAKSGMMGEGEQEKYESEFGKEGSGAIKGRAGFDGAFGMAASSCGLGLGGHLRCHSVMANSLACEGVVGLLFWLYFYVQVFWWCRRRLPYAGKNTAFILVMILSAVWDVFGSPFGTRHKFFVLMTFIALCRDNNFFGIGSVFDESLAMTRRR